MVGARLGVAGVWWGGQAKSMSKGNGTQYLQNVRRAGLLGRLIPVVR
jgi:hypothetical protein